jgi:hypothetical protein
VFFRTKYTRKKEKSFFYFPVLYAMDLSLQDKELANSLPDKELQPVIPGVHRMSGNNSEEKPGFF